eukprot:c20759_g1_i1.p1 GENE.c20759_g1_i1~~c20759_g1_i1.p1  ORF type:complete len:188 (+),score=42.83 c20759_g1_i1:1-564(+)
MWSSSSEFAADDQVDDPEPSDCNNSSNHTSNHQQQRNDNIPVIPSAHFAQQPHLLEAQHQHIESQFNSFCYPPVRDALSQNHLATAYATQTSTVNNLTPMRVRSHPWHLDSVQCTGAVCCHLQPLPGDCHSRCHSVDPLERFMIKKHPHTHSSLLVLARVAAMAVLPEPVGVSQEKIRLPSFTSQFN